MDGKEGSEIVGKEKGVKDLFAGVAERTAMHGLPNVYRSRTIGKRIFWSLLCLVAVVICIKMLSEAFIKYYSYPTETTVTENLGFSQVFPAVTICNMNQIKSSKVHFLMDRLKLTDPDIAETSFSKLLSKFNESSEDEVNHTPRNGSEGVSDDGTKWKVLSEYFSRSLEERAALGHDLKDMLLYCSFRYDTCDESNFTRVLSSHYGNCYTFNSGADGAPLVAKKTGPQRGSFYLELYIDQHDYVPDISLAAGIRVVIHNQTAMPFPEDEGYSVSPGSASFIGLQKTNHYLSPPPYGSCIHVTNETSYWYNAYTEDNPHVGYTSQACKKTCYQFFVMVDCACCDPDFPMNTASLKNMTGLGDLESCSTNDSKVNCWDDTYTWFQESESECARQCPPPCSFSQYKTSLSTASWPHAKSIDDYMAVVKEKEPAIEEWSKQPDFSKESFIKNNILKIFVYFETFDYREIKTEPSYTVNSLLSDLGGLFGLWLGFSVLALSEFLELIWDVFFMCFRKHSPKKNNNSKENGTEQELKELKKDQNI